MRERLEAYREAGVTSLNIVPIDPNPTALIEKLKTWTT